MESLPRDVFTECISFLWLRDVDSLSCCSRSLHSIVKEGPYLYTPMLLRLNRTVNNIQLSRTGDLEGKARLLAERAIYWPMCVDHRGLPRDINIDLSHDKKQFTYHFTGSHLGGNRVLCADMHFPYILPSGTEPLWEMEGDARLIRSCSPFAKPCVTDGVLSSRLSCVAYFEVTIGPTPGYIEDRNASSRTNGRSNRRPCMCVGLVNPKCGLQDRMPGWDSRSYGYHGDDGHYFHGSGTGVRFGPTFGAGDVIGCGVIYPPLVLSPPVLFFVKNGIFINSITLMSTFLESPWFPAVGVDSFSEVSVNFGASPFQFDIVKFEHNQIEKRCRVAAPVLPSREALSVRPEEIPVPADMESVVPRDDIWAFNVFFKNEISSDTYAALRETASITLLEDYYQHTLFCEDRLLWKPDMLSISELQSLDRQIQLCRQLLQTDDDAKLEAARSVVSFLVVRPGYSGRMPARTDCYILRVQRQLHQLPPMSHPSVPFFATHPAFLFQAVVPGLNLQMGDSDSSFEMETDDYASDESSSFADYEEDDEDDGSASSSSGSSSGSGSGGSGVTNEASAMNGEEVS